MGKLISTTDTNDVINPGESYYVQFRVNDAITNAAVAVSSCPIKLHVVGESTLLYSGSLRTNITDTNLVEIQLTAADNAITTTYGLEKRRVLCNVAYPGGTQKYAFLYSIEWNAVV